MKKYLGLIVVMVFLMITGCGTASKAVESLKPDIGQTGQSLSKNKPEFFFTQANGHP